MELKVNWKKNINYIKNRYKRIRIGLRTAKTVAAVLISMLVIASMGLSSSKMIFAMLGAMATMENTFKASVEACLTQIVGLVFGAIMGLLLLSLPVPAIINAGIGVGLIIVLYNLFQIRYSPVLSCLIMVTLCMTPDIEPIDYAVGRLGASAIGLLIGLIINTLVFPYDNSNKIRETIDYLDKELILFLEDMFDGDSHLPDTVKMSEMIEDMNRQLKIFSGQSFLLRKGKKRHQLEVFRSCAGKERQLIAHMIVLCRLKKPGRLNEENVRLLCQAGARIKDERRLEPGNELDIITNYHVKQLMNLRRELKTELTAERIE